MKNRALLLVGHGSSNDSGAALPVYENAARIRGRGVFDEVRVAFWKQEPHLDDAFAGIASDEIYVVPMFLADGYFTRQVIPRVLGLQGRTTRLGTRTMHHRAPVGVHPAMAALTAWRALEVGHLHSHERRNASVVVIGHGTERDAMSDVAVRQVCVRIRDRGYFRDVHEAYLDQEPRVARVVPAITGANVILVPYLLSEGWHTRETIPQQLALTGARTVQNGRVLWYARPVGTLPGLARIAVAIAHQDVNTD